MYRALLWLHTVVGQLCMVLLLRVTADSMVVLNIRTLLYRLHWLGINSKLIPGFIVACADL